MKRAFTLGRLYRTLRHLKPEQVFYQAYYRVCRMLNYPKPRVPDMTGAALADISALKLTPPSGAHACLDLAKGRFRFIGLEHCFGGGIDWSGAELGKLWDYNLHYFEWLWGLDPLAAKAAVQDWIRHHPNTADAVGWEPYPLSLRVMNWIAYFGTVAPETLEEDPGFLAQWIDSIGAQCDWLTRRLERHLLGNHLLENGVALWVAGNFVRHPEAQHWQATGRAILEKELPEQVLADGMHFERSPMYHNRLVHLLEWLCRISAAGLSLDLEALRKKALDAAAKLQHPDGRIALFNDSAFGIYPEAQVAASSSGAFALQKAGYYGVRTEAGDYWIADAGRIGPDYLPGHAHCDIGSFELSLRGKRWITDTGVFHYENSGDRHESRSTAAHNTFGPRGVEQAEIWSSFRVGDRPDVELRKWSVSDDAVVLALSHDGYDRALKQKVCYRRRFEFSKATRTLRITDDFAVGHAMDWEGRLHFAPGVELVEQEGNRVLLRSGEERVQVTLEGADDVTLRDTPYWPEFNVRHNRLSLFYRRKAQQGEVRAVVDWSLE